MNFLVILRDTVSYFQPLSTTSTRINLRIYLPLQWTRAIVNSDVSLPNCALSALWDTVDNLPQLSSTYFGFRLCSSLLTITCVFVKLHKLQSVNIRCIRIKFVTSITCLSISLNVYQHLNAPTTNYHLLVLTWVRSYTMMCYSSQQSASRVSKKLHTLRPHGCRLICVAFVNLL